MESLIGFVVIIWAKAKVCNHITEQSLTHRTPAALPVLGFPRQKPPCHRFPTTFRAPVPPLTLHALSSIQLSSLLGHLQIQNLSSFTIILMRTLFFLIPLSYSTDPKNIPSLGESDLFSPLAPGQLGEHC